MGNWNENEDAVRGLLSSHRPNTGNSTRTYDSIDAKGRRRTTAGWWLMTI
ncbi:hypothetical protein MtrunA17_Chr5g0430121 [Medicago truncatula]|uniref:Uncharacterized protein n=1 Tax=Medicago truncatula TaxID=3880 RepID=A0A396HVF5_MEDTR|nr:hypothetical protein MtrunA17_Chr5g0430121 [Medicago truncatula]